jgi:hypothetical protein
MAILLRQKISAVPQASLGHFLLDAVFAVRFHDRICLFPRFAACRLHPKVIALAETLSVDSMSDVHAWRGQQDDL